MLRVSSDKQSYQRFASAPRNCRDMILHTPTFFFNTPTEKFLAEI